LNRLKQLEKKHNSSYIPVFL